MGEYEVEGYGAKSSYDGPYLKGADFDPNVAFAKSGDPEAQAEHQKELVADIDGVDDFEVIRFASPEKPTDPDTAVIVVTEEPAQPDLKPEGTESETTEPEAEVIEINPEPETKPSGITLE